MVWFHCSGISKGPLYIRNINQWKMLQQIDVYIVQRPHTEIGHTWPGGKANWCCHKLHGHSNLFGAYFMHASAHLTITTHVMLIMWGLQLYLWGRVNKALLGILTWSTSSYAGVDPLPPAILNPSVRPGTFCNSTITCMVATMINESQSYNILVSVSTCKHPLRYWRQINVHKDAWQLTSIMVHWLLCTVMID